MSIFAGTTELANIYVGTTEIQDIYVGTTNVWTQAVAGEGRLFACDYSLDKAYEIDPDTLVVLNTSTATYAGTPYGIGGVIDRLYLLENTNNNTYELDPDTLTSINSRNRAIATSRAGIGGTATKLYLCDDTTGYLGIWEINTSTLNYVTQYTQPNATPRGVGGTYDRLFSTGTSGGDYIYELNTSTLSVINSGLFTPTGYTNGGIRDIGGTNTRLYVVRSDLDRIYEIDPDTFSILNSSSQSVIGGSPAGVGGIKVLI
jgi:hypothetical protein